MTGYTGTAYEKKMDFKQFAMLCARNFGACIDLREEPFEAPIPEEFKPSEHEATRLKECSARHAELAAMTEAQRLAYGESAKKKAIDSDMAAIRAADQTVAYFRRLERDVQAWTPPTPGHVGMKEFMLQQIQETIKYADGSYYREGIIRHRQMLPLEWYDIALTEASRNIAYYTEEHRKAVERAGSRTGWIKALRESLKD